jgi:cell division septum initiation protein DivIVA
MASGVDQRVAAILSAAEDAAEEIRRKAEQAMQERIAEGVRAAEHRVRAAEDEAAEIVAAARQDAARVREAAEMDARRVVEEATSRGRDEVARAHAEADRVRMEAGEAREQATGEALAVIARAQSEAERIQREAEAKARELLKVARTAAGDVSIDGTQIVADLRELGDSLRSNAARLLRDVQALHSAMVASIDRVDPEHQHAPPVSALRGAAAGGAVRRSIDPGLDVPEFIPPN